MAGENSDLAQHIKNCHEYEKTGRRQRLTLLSSTFVNKTLLMIRQYLVRSIVNEIDRCGGHFGLMMDGSQDISFQEQISVVARYIDENNKVVERTISFFNAKKTTGEKLYELLRIKLSEIGLRICNVVGCSFDGAPNMRGDFQGVISYIKRNDNSNCFFSWCLSHRFNLCVTAAVSSSMRIKQVLILVEESAKTFRGSYKKMNVWVEVAKTVPNFNSQRRLKLIGKTRWSSKQDALESIISDETNLYVLIKALLKLCSLDNLDGDALINASNSLNSWLRYDNVVVAFTLHKVFSLVSPTTKFLQTMGLNILDGVRSLKKCKHRLQEFKESLENWIEEAHKFVENTNSLLSKDEQIRSLDCECSISVPTEDERQKKINLIKNTFFNFIQKLEDEIVEKVLTQFDDSDSIHHEMSFLDPLTAEEKYSNRENLISLRKLCEINKIPDEEAVINELKKFTSEFSQYLNRSEMVSFLNDTNEFENETTDANTEQLALLIESESDCEETLADLEYVPIQSMYEKKCSCIDCILKYLSLNQERIKTYEHVLELYKYVARLPSTQVKCERDFSKLKLTKTRLRSSLSEKSLENLMLISTECAMFKDINLNEIIDEIIASSPQLTLFAGL